MPEIETHPFAPVLPADATVMMMGTFPPAAKKRAMAFHYPNFQNDMWRIYGLVFFDDAAYFQVAGERRFDAARIRDFLIERGIALCPSVRRAVRGQGNASDKFLEVVEPVDLAGVLAQLPECRRIFTTGGKATEVLLGFLPEKTKAPKVGSHISFSYRNRALELWRLPSTSRAYPLSLAKKAAAYRAFFEAAGLL
ncbi:MAG: DNA glycosylase [Neisseria sp.]|nr:DNA glycosylase [Neisseria sp.]